MKNIFNKKVSDEVINRINSLTAETKPHWGKMNVAQMLAHCNVTYEMVYDENIPKPTGFKKFLLKLFVKNIVVGDKPYKKNSRTAPEFLITGDKNFEKEKVRLIDHINKTQKLAATYFDSRESHSFGKLSDDEWNNMFYKHLDHHLTQFGV